MLLFLKKVIRSCFMAIILVSFFSPGVFGDSQDPVKTTTKEEEAMAKGISKKMDKTIKVLTVIKEELDDYQKDVEAEGDTKAAKTSEEEGMSWGAKIGRMIKAWRKAKKAADEGTPQDEAREEEEEKVWTENVKSKVDKTIGALEAIRKELDKIEKAEE